MKDYALFKFRISEIIECLPANEVSLKREEIRLRFGYEKEEEKGRTWLSRIENTKLTDRKSLNIDQLLIFSNCLNCELEELINPLYVLSCIGIESKKNAQQAA